MSFKKLDPEDILVSADSITAPVWSNFSASLTGFFTNPSQISGQSGQYYVNAYDQVSSATTAQVQFAVSYGDSRGSGSLWYNSGARGLSPTRTVYGQFLNLIYGEDEGASFNFNGVVQPNFYAIVFNRARYKQALLPGSLQLSFAGGATIITDDSAITPVVNYLSCGRVFNLGSGSNGNGVMPAGSTNGSYGLFLPDIGTIILNPAAITGGTVSGPTTNPLSNTNATNWPQTLINDIDLFALQSQETVTSDFIFCRARNAEFNYSVNPSFSVSASAGSILQNIWVQNPTTYITSVGMYNDNNELLAVAKLSKPLKKDFTKEALIRVKLDF
jgi:hypothetical protein